MLKYQLIDEGNDFVSYRYFPEGKPAYGEITVNKFNKQLIKQTIAPDDEFKWYYLKMLKRIREFVDCGVFNKEGTIVWY